jgi:hypothetical protein
VRNPGEGGAQQQDAAALKRRCLIVRGTELVVPDDFVVADGGVPGTAWLTIIENQDALAVPAEMIADDEDVPGVPDEMPSWLPDAWLSRTTVSACGESPT